MRRLTILDMGVSRLYLGSNTEFAWANALNRRRSKRAAHVKNKNRLPRWRQSCRNSPVASAGGNTRTPDQCELGFAVTGASPKKVFTCQLCGKVLCSKASLKRHIADKHAERQEEYRCVICERVYCSRNSLMTHIYTYHKSRPGDIDIKFF